MHLPREMLFHSFLFFPSLVFSQLLVLSSSATFMPSVKLSWMGLLNVSVQGSVHCPSILCVAVTDRHTQMSVLFEWNPAEFKLVSLWLREGNVVRILSTPGNVPFSHPRTRESDFSLIRQLTFGQLAYEHVL